MADLAHPHDQFAKGFIEIPNSIFELIRLTFTSAFLALVKLCKPERLKTDFIDELLHEHFSDGLFKIGEMEIDRTRSGMKAKRVNVLVLMLIEHKSKPDPFVSIQLGLYMMLAWRRCLNDNPKEPLPIIIPFVLYHGKEEWTGPLNIQSLFENVPDDLAAFVPHFDIAILDLSAVQDSDIQGSKEIRACLLLMKYIQQPNLDEMVIRILEDLPPDTDEAIKCLKSIFQYLSSVHNWSQEKISEVLNKAYPRKGETIVATIVERWIEEGIEKGIEKGRREQLLESVSDIVVARLELPRLTDTQKVAIERLTGDQLRHLLREAIRFDSTEQLDRWLSENTHSQSNS